MRTLRFIVEDQIITQDPDCDFSNLVPGTEGYIQAEFIFSPEWDGYTKVASFSSGRNEYTPKILEGGQTCLIPTEALARYIFMVRVLGRKNDTKLKTNSVAVRQNGGKV